MRTLTYNGGIFDEGNGWIFRKVMNWTFPGLLLAAAEIGLINAGILSEGKIPRPAMTVILIFTVIYVIPSVFAFPHSLVPFMGKDTPVPRELDRFIQKENRLSQSGLHDDGKTPLCRFFGDTASQSRGQEGRVYPARRCHK